MLYKQKENREHLEKIFERRVEQVQQLVGQVLHTTFTPQGGDQGVPCVGSEVIIVGLVQQMVTWYKNIIPTLKNLKKKKRQA